jgi:hypothetical protein
MGKDGAKLPVPDQKEDPDAGAYHALLKQDRIGRGGIVAQTAVQFCRIPGITHTDLETAPHTVLGHRPDGFEHNRKLRDFEVRKSFPG